MAMGLVSIIAAVWLVGHVRPLSGKVVGLIKGAV